MAFSFSGPRLVKYVIFYMSTSGPDIFCIKKLPLQWINHVKTNWYLTDYDTMGIQKPDIWKPETFENRTFWCPVFKWHSKTSQKSVWFSNGVRKPDHLGTDLMSTIRKTDTSRPVFGSPLYKSFNIGESHPLTWIYFYLKTFWLSLYCRATTASWSQSN